MSPHDGNGSPKICEKLESPRSHHDFEVNDVIVHADIMDLTVQPCRENFHEDLITWKQIASSQLSSSKLKNEPEWYRHVDKLDQTFVVIESLDDINFISDTDAVEHRSKSFRDNSVMNESFNFPFGDIDINDITRTSTPVDLEELLANRKDSPFGENYKEIISSSSEHTSRSRSAFLMHEEMSPPKPVDLLESSTITRIPPINLCDDVSVTTDSLDSAKSREIMMRRRLRKKMHLLRRSTDSIVSSYDTSRENCHHSTPNKCPVFPVIPSDVGSHCFHQGRKRISYLERAVKNSRNRFMTLPDWRLEHSKTPVILPPIISVHRR